MSRRLPLLAACLALWLPTVALARQADQRSTLPFIERNRAARAMELSRPDACASLVRTAIAQKMSRTAGQDRADFQGVAVSERGCQVVSFDHDGRLEVVGSADLYGGNGPLSLVVVYEHAGLLDETDIPIGEGNGNLGPVGLALTDINHDGRLEVIETARSVYPDGRMAAATDPAPTVTHIYVWRGMRLVEATADFRPYIAGTVLPTLLRDLAQAPAKGGPGVGRTRASALSASVYYARKLVATGRY